MKPIVGRAWLFPDNVNTDVIHPPAFFSLDPEVVRRGLFNGLDPQLQGRLRAHDILVAGRNFGCGSSRETSIRSLLLNRIGAVVAIDFARIFFRNATNSGLPCLTFADPADLTRIHQHDRLEIHCVDAVLQTPSGDRIDLEPIGSFVRRIWEAGGLLDALPQQGLRVPGGEQSGSGAGRHPEGGRHGAG